MRWSFDEQASVLHLLAEHHSGGGVRGRAVGERAGYHLRLESGILVLATRMQWIKISGLAFVSGL